MDVNRLVIEHLDLWTSATEKKSSAGRGNGGAVSLYGIAKLRKLILELAVSGKLVLQDNFTQERMDAAQEALRNATGLLVADGKARISGKIELDLVRSTDLATPNWYEASGQLIFPTRSGNSKLIKGKQHSEPASNLYPGFGSISGIGAGKLSFCLLWALAVARPFRLRANGARLPIRTLLGFCPTLLAYRLQCCF